MTGGYTGRILRVDLTEGTIAEEPVPADEARDYLGGSGFGTKILWDEVPPEIGPLEPGNRLVFAAGPLTGTAWPSPARLAVIARSPLTDGYGDANAGGHFTPELKFAGYDAIVFQGRAPRPVYLFVRDGEASLEDAGFLWGRGTEETQRLIRDRHARGGIEKAERIKVSSIGPAGENLVRFASIQVTDGRSVARAGMGAVMGSKNLKAVALLSGTRRVPVADETGFKDAAKRANKKVRENRFTEGEHKYGTPLIASIINQIGRFPTRNFQAGHCDYIDEISGETLHERFFDRHMSCWGCPIGCDKQFSVKEGEFAGTITTSLEYEALSSLGSRCGNSNLDSIVEGNRLCDDLGMDVISAGGVVGFAMELWEKGLIGPEETGGLDLTWGNYRSILTMLGQIARRENFGDVLAEGVKRAAAAVGKGAEDYAIHVKGMEISAQDGRAQQSMGLAHATSSRGADHLKAFPTLDETGFPEEAAERYGEEFLPELVDGMATTYKPMYVKDGEDFAAVVDSLGICKFGTMFPPALYWEDLAEGVTTVTGVSTTGEDLKLLGERIVNLQRCFNVRAGMSRKDDTLPKRLLEEKSPSQRAKGHVVYLEPMLDEYYRLRGWDPVTGYPTAETLERLGLSFAPAELPKDGG